MFTAGFTTEGHRGESQFNHGWTQMDTNGVPVGATSMLPGIAGTAELRISRISRMGNSRRMNLEIRRSGKSKERGLCSKLLKKS